MSPAHIAHDLYEPLCLTRLAASAATSGFFMGPKNATIRGFGKRGCRSVCIPLPLRSEAGCGMLDSRSTRTIAARTRVGLERSRRL